MFVIHNLGSVMVTIEVWW